MAPYTAIKSNGKQNGDMGADKAPDASNYYAKGSSELATDTPLTLRRLEVRRKLTRNSHRLVVALVGLPARGKSFVARKLQNFLIWYGIECKIFNVGRYRRRAHAEATSSSGACDANFFDSKNSEAAALRERVAAIALEDMLLWLDGDNDSEDDDDSSDSSTRSRSSSSCGDREGQTLVHGMSDRIAIFDATNSTDKRRQWILEQCTSPEKRPGKPTGVVFVESICDDEELLLENFRFKISNSPDYRGMKEEEALADLRNRVQKYEEQYETIKDDSLSYIKVFNLSSKLLVNHIYGRMSKVIVPALMAWNIGTRPVFLCRSGQTSGNCTPPKAVPQDMPINDSSHLSPNNNNSSTRKSSSSSSVSIGSSSSRRQNMRGNRLNDAGKRFSEALYKFVHKECIEFQKRRSSIMDMAPTGTSLTGLASPAAHYDHASEEPPFPLQVFTSTMPRAVETAKWDSPYSFRVDELSNLNPLDKGDFAEKDIGEVGDINPEWYNRLVKHPFYTRFPGGESYSDLIRRLESTIVDVEQQVIPTLVISHVSTLQVLMAYFRGSPVEKCMSIEVPMHTVLKFTPVRGGGWKESQHPISPVDDNSFGQERNLYRSSLVLPSVTSISELSNLTVGGDHDELFKSTPIWGDHMRRGSTVTFNEKLHALPL